MKIIDEKGKLFGKINLIDFLIILFLVSLVPIFILGYKVKKRMQHDALVEQAELDARKREAQRQEEERLKKEKEDALVQEEQAKERERNRVFVQVEINFLLIKLSHDHAELIRVGNTELDENKNQIAEVSWVGQTTPYIYEIDVGAANKLTFQDPVLLQVPVKLKIKAELREGHLYYKGNEILEGRTFVMYIVSRRSMEEKAITVMVEAKVDFGGSLNSSPIAIQEKLFTIERKMDDIISILHQK